MSTPVTPPSSPTAPPGPPPSSPAPTARPNPYAAPPLAARSGAPHPGVPQPAAPHPGPSHPQAPRPAPTPPAPGRTGLSRTAVGLLVGVVCLVVGGGTGYAAGVATDAGARIAAWVTAPTDDAYGDEWPGDGWSDEDWSEGDWEGTGTRDDPWLFDGYTIGGVEWEVLLEEPYEATAEVLAHDDVNTPPPDGTEYWIVPVTATYTGFSSQVTAWGAVDIGFIGDDGVSADGGCGAVPQALVGTGLIGAGDTVTGNVCLAVPAGAPGLWTLSLEREEPWYLRAADPLAG
ncbi:hypothetical protein NSA53_04590 [Cellulosimicrobium cellulans]|uniref:hypothetical protein n=1 Tax=Cellulosimicrobium cellulans TaxID=1710 RepID=UPI002149EC1B|nr:hypothetical protein [Cellulosimicrobium cellulans]